MNSASPQTEIPSLSATPTLSETAARLWNRLPSVVRTLIPALSALLIVLVPANFLIGSRFYQITTENLGAQHQALLAEIGGQFDRYIAARGAELSDLARGDEIRACAPQNCTALSLFVAELTTLLSNPNVYPLEVGFLTLEGKETGRAIRGSGGIVVAPGELPAFEADSSAVEQLKTLAAGQAYLFPIARDPRISPSEAYQQPVMRLATTVTGPDGQIAGFVTAVFGVDDFFAQQFVPSEGRQVFLLDTERCLLATSDTSRRADTYKTWSGAPDRVCLRDLPVLEWDVNAQRYRDTLFSTRVVSAGLISSGQAWTIVVQEDAAQVYAQANGLQTLLSAAHLLTGILVAVLIITADRAAKRLANAEQIRLSAQAREMRYNPYEFTVPVDEPALFFGRKIPMATALGMGVMGGENVMIVGGPGSGKTSMLHQVERRVREQRVADPSYFYWPVLINAQGIDADQFYAALAERLLRDVEDHRTRTDLQYHRFVAGKRNTYDVSDFSIDINELIELPNAAGRQTRVVILLDNIDAWQRVDPEWRDEFFRLFRRVGAYLTLIATCTPEAESVFDEWLSPIRIGNLDRDDAIRLIREPVAKYYQFTDEAVETILAESRQHPRELQRLAHGAVRVMLEQEGTAVTRAHAERAYRQIREG